MIRPKATDHIKEMIKSIKILEEKGFAYESNGDVYFDVEKYKDEYGQLSGQNIEDLKAGARIEVTDIKKSSVDFALWKAAKEGELSWGSPWGKGRPGWHIECSAMSMKHLGQTIDIHAGGSDLIFPHHENEIAQSEASCGHDFVKYWIHFGFLNLNETKMSKSLGNFFTAREILKKYSANAIRLFFSQTHYAGQLNFSAELLEAAEKGLEKITNLAQKINSIIPSIEKGLNTFEQERYVFAFESAMDDNFNTPKALAAVYDFVRDLNKFLSKNEKVPREVLENAKEFLKSTLTDVLGIEVFSSQSGGSSKESFLMQILINLRNEAKKNKDYKTADEIRDKLKEAGIILEDSKDGTTYKYVK
jgi:cysteinyl-tRNA synthetase